MIRRLLNKLLNDTREQATHYPRRIFNREGTKTAKAPREHVSGAPEEGRQPVWVKGANKAKNESE